MGDTWAGDNGTASGTAAALASAKAGNQYLVSDREISGFLSQSIFQFHTCCCTAIDIQLVARQLLMPSVCRGHVLSHGPPLADGKEHALTSA